MEYRAFLGTCCEGMRRKRTDRDREREADCAVLYSRVGMPGRRRTRGPRDEEARGQRGSCTLTITISIAGFQQWGRYFKNRILIRAGNPTLCNPYVSTWWMRGLAPSCVRVCHRSSSCLSLPSSHSRCLQLFPSWSYSFFILNYYHPHLPLCSSHLSSLSRAFPVSCILSPRASACSSGNSGTAHMRRKERRKGEGEAVFLRSLTTF